MRKRWISLLVTGLLVGGALAPATPALAAPTFRVPFPCGQTWSGQTRSDHSPAYAVDFNRTDDSGDPVVASAPGTVDRVTDLGGTSYGKYVRINHGGGYSTYYAHLSGFNVSVGQTVGYGKVIGWVGSTGDRPARTCTTSSASTAADIQVRFNGTWRCTGAPRATPVATGAPRAAATALSTPAARR